MTAFAVAASSSGDDIVSELEGTVSQLASIAGGVVVQASAAVRDAVLGHVDDVRGTRSVSGLGATLDVRSDSINATGSDQASVALVASPAGAWGLVDGGARPHGLRRRRGMPADPYGVFSRISHPGTAGLGVWNGSLVAADAAADAAVDEVIGRLPSDG